MKLKKFLVSTLTAVFFLTSSNLGVLATTMNNSMDAKSQGSFKERVSAEVNEALEKQEFVKVLVELNENADLEKAKLEGMNTLQKDASVYEKKMIQRYSVVNALREVATISQYNLIKLLDEEKEAGNVNEYESFYIVNMLYVDCNEKVIKKIAECPEVKSVTLDGTVQIDKPIIDESAIELQSTTGNIEWGVNKVGAPSVWDTYGVKGEGVVVGVIDSGFDWTHEALQSKWRGYNAENPSVPNSSGNWFDAVAGKTVPYDDAAQPHGSHVTGTIVGQDPEGKNVIGVAPEAKFIVAKAFTPDGGSQSDILEAAEWMLAPNGDPALAPDVINNSWGGSPGLSEWFRPMVSSWRAAGILPVFSAGNEPNGVPAPPASVSAPGNYPECFAVGATDINDVRGIFSRRGPSPYADDVKPDIAAPGVNVRSSVPGGYEGGWSGTSMAAPHITGTAALLLSYNPNLTIDDVEDIIRNTATPLTDSDYQDTPNFGYGYGLVNAFDAIASISSGRGEINGYVLQEGDDLEEPVITNHEPVEKTYVALSTQIEAEVSDDISIKDSSILLRLPGTSYDIIIPMTRMSGNHNAAKFQGTIPGNLVREPGFKYKIRVIDFGNNIVETEYYDVQVIFGDKPEELSTDFSTEPTDWFLIDGDWEWGVPTGKPNKGENDKVMATKVAGNYSNNSESYLVTPLLDLREVDQAFFTFDHFYETENNSDKCIIAATNDYGQNWSILKQYTNTNSAWQKQRISLNEFAGSQTPVLVAFIFMSDSSIVKLGWYIDNFALYSVDNIAPATPQNLVVNTTAMGPELSWNPVDDVDADLKGYNVYRSTTSQAIELANVIGNSATNKYVDSAFEAGEGYNYFVTSIDYNNNESEHSNIVTAIMPRIEFRYDSNFEDNDGGMTVGGTKQQWQWGTPTSGPNGASSGTKLWATKLAGQYEASSDSWIQLPSVNLENTSNATLGFNYWLQSENKYDKAFVEIKKAGETTWKELAMYMGEAAQGEQVWKNKSIDISAYVGNTVDIRFRFKTDSSGQRTGWYLDDVKVAVTAGGGTASIVPDESYSEDEYYSEDVEYSLDEKLPSDLKEEIEYSVDRILLDDGNSSDQVYYTEDNLAELMAITGIPVEAVVSVVESGRGTKVNLIDGSYKLPHPANDDGEKWTIRVSSYGYDTQYAEVSLGADMAITQNFKLVKSATGKLHGTLVDKRTNAPIAGAFIKVVEDPRVAPVVTDENGTFTIDKILTGAYTLSVSHAEYKGMEVPFEINGYEEKNIEISLDPFIGYSKEIAYDDGIAENARAMKDPGNGWAVRFTPESYGIVKSVKVYLYDNSWPVPGNSKFQLSVYDSNEAGEATGLILKTDVINGARGQWNEVDISQYGFSTNRDFYVVVHHVGVYPDTFGMAMDEGSYAARSYQFVEGSFTLLEEKYGNAMVRANVDYELDAPTIVSINNGAFVNVDNIDLIGKVKSDCQVRLLVNGEEVEVITTENREFAVNIPLVEGPNVVRTSAIINGKETDPKEITINRDMTLPVINVTAPVDNFETNKEVVTVVGTINEVNLSSIVINDEAVQFNNENGFEHKLILQSGENTIVVVAKDRAGNQSVREIKVKFNGVSSQITEIKPDNNMVVKAGDKVIISFRSELQGGSAYYSVNLPMGMDSQDNMKPMVEKTPGYYEAEWTVPEGLSAADITISLKLVDKYGNETLAEAPGKLRTFDRAGYVSEITSITLTEEFGVSVINAEIRNICNQTIAPTLIVMVTDKDNRVINISTARISELLPDGTIVLGAGFKKPAPGQYKVKAFVWTGIDTMEPLAQPVEEIITIN